MNLKYCNGQTGKLVMDDETGKMCLYCFFGRTYFRFHVIDCALDNGLVFFSDTVYVFTYQRLLQSP